MHHHTHGRAHVALALSLILFACGADPSSDAPSNPDASVVVDPQGPIPAVDGAPAPVDAGATDATFASDAPACPAPVDATAPDTSCVCPAPVCDPPDAGPKTGLGAPPYFWHHDAGVLHVNYLAVGDSITAGAELIPGNGSPQPALAYPTVAAHRMGSNVTVSDIGQLGWTLQQMLDAGVGEGGTLDIWKRGTPANTINVLSLMGGDNDIHYDASASEIEARISEYVRQAHIRGWLVVVCTIPPVNYPSWTPWQTADVDAWIMSGGSGADGVCDFNDPIMKELAPPSDVHPTVDGHVWMADRLIEGMAPLLIEAGAR